MEDLLPGGTQPWHRLDASKSHHFSQMLIHRCLNDRNPLLIQMEDKYRSRSIVQEKGAGRLTTLYHWSDTSTTLPWESLPLRCVIKTNHWSGEALFIMDNGKEPLADVRRVFRPWARHKNGYRVIRRGMDQYGIPWPKWRIERTLKKCLNKAFLVPLEWGAANIQPRGIMVEELLLDGNTLPHDWKVHVFHGKVGFIQYDIGRIGEHFQAIYDLDGKRIEQTNPLWNQGLLPATLDGLLSSEQLASLVATTERLAEDIDYTRVDMFLVNGDWVFGEFTNYHNSGIPQSLEWEELGGRLWSRTEGS
jgi:hypothetical protein